MLNDSPSIGTPARASSAPHVIHRLRVVYERLGDVRFISHLDMTNTLNRALRRAEMPVAYTEGFSPRPRTAFGPPLPLFVEGAREIADIEMEACVPVDDAIRRVNGVLPLGIRIVEARYVPPKAPSITASIRTARYRIVPRGEPLDLTPEWLAEFLARPTIEISKDAKGGAPKGPRAPEAPKKIVDIRPAILSLELADGGLDALLMASPERTLNVFDLMGALVPGFNAASSAAFRVVRADFTLDPACETAPPPAPVRAPSASTAG